MGEAILTLTGLTRRFGALVACEDISLDLRAGEIHALIGPNGAGKSTLTKLICGELEPDSGSVALNGTSLDGLTAAQRARQGLARTFQISSVLPQFTVRQNVTMAAAAKADSSRNLRPLMGQKSPTTQADEQIDRFGLSAISNHIASTISHGERRALEVAMAMAFEPKVLVMDEPMAGMGAEGSQRLTEQLATIKQDAPILLIEHDMDAVFALADRLSVLVSGKIIATGTVDEIRNDPAVQTAYLGSKI